MCNNLRPQLAVTYGLRAPSDWLIHIAEGKAGTRFFAAVHGRLRSRAETAIIHTRHKRVSSCAGVSFGTQKSWPKTMEMCTALSNRAERTRSTISSTMLLLYSTGPPMRTLVLAMSLRFWLWHHPCTIQSHGLLYMGFSVALAAEHDFSLQFAYLRPKNEPCFHFSPY